MTSHGYTITGDHYYFLNFYRLKDLDKSSDEAINQIKDKKYVEGLKSSGYRNIKAYGIAFFDKSWCVKLM